MAKLFISYRRKSWPFTHRLAEHLRRLLDAEVFVDVDGVDETNFESSILKHLRNCDAVLLVVSEYTFTADRIQQPKDWVRREIALALKLRKPIVLVGIDGLVPPAPENLPDDIHDITHQQSIEFYPRYFDAASQALAEFIAKVTSIKLRRVMLRNRLITAFTALVAILTLIGIGSLLLSRKPTPTVTQRSTQIAQQTITPLHSVTTHETATINAAVSATVVAQTQVALAFTSTLSPVFTAPVNSDNFVVAPRTQRAQNTANAIDSFTKTPTPTFTASTTATDTPNTGKTVAARVAITDTAEVMNAIASYTKTLTPTATFTATNTPSNTPLLVPTFTGTLPQESPQTSKLSGKLEIFSWWAGNEAPALDALLILYNSKYPDVKVTNSTVAGGSGVGAKTVLKTRMLGGNSPDSFQVHAGQELTSTWVVANRMESLSALYKSEGWEKKLPKDLLDLLTYKGQIYSVPVSISRSNVLWYVPDNLRKWGIEVPRTWDDFLKICTTLKGKDVTPLALGPNWTAMHLFENVLLAQLGVDNYRALWAGRLKWTDDKVKAAWTLFGKVLDCTNKDAASLGDWVPASQLMLDGEAAFQIMGDWFVSWAIAAKKLTPSKDLGWSPAPGTQGVFIMLGDSFGLPKGAPDRDNVIAWLKLLGSVEGQDAFNPLRGSIPARLDADVKNAKLYNVYLQSAAADWTKNKLVGSLTHGAVAPELFSSQFATVLDVFIGTRDVNLAANASQELANQSGISK